MLPVMRHAAVCTLFVMSLMSVALVASYAFNVLPFLIVPTMACGILALLFVLKQSDGQLRDQLKTQQSRLEQSEHHADSCATALRAVQRELEEKDSKLRQADRLSDLGQLTATVSHEIRNPLSVIRTAVHVMRNKSEKVGLDLNRPLDRAQRAVARCDDIVNDMLEYARANELQTEMVDSSRYLNDILDEQPVPANITLLRNLPEPGLELHIDRDRFRRAIINLVSNAAEAIKDGGIEDGLITVTCLPDCPRHSIQIFNNGPAIPQEVLDRMYEPLYTTKSNGSGIGLPTVKKLIEQHGAELHCETGEDVGTTWTILLQPDVDATGETAECASQKLAA